MLVLEGSNCGDGVAHDLGYAGYILHVYVDSASIIVLLYCLL